MGVEPGVPPVTSSNVCLYCKVSWFTLGTSSCGHLCLFQKDATASLGDGGREQCVLCGRQTPGLEFCILASHIICLSLCVTSLGGALSSYSIFR